MEVEKKLSVEDLMKPRYMVIADYPADHSYKVGQILVNVGGFTIPYQGNYKTFLLDDYPHLFKKLEWWQERKESDLRKVEYVKVINYESGYWNKGSIISVVKFCAEKDKPLGYYVTHNSYIPIYNLEPATESEYLTLNK